MAEQSVKGAMGLDVSTKLALDRTRVAPSDLREFGLLMISIGLVSLLLEFKILLNNFSCMRKRKEKR